MHLSPERSTRRRFLRQAVPAAAAAMLLPQLLRASGKANPVLLITSGWQDVNIGDIAHTPGLLAVLKKRMPKARIILWKKSRSEKVETMLGQHYPDVRIIHGAVNEAFVPQAEEVKAAFAEADLFIHGSGPSVMAADYLQAWHRQTRKPFGLFGVTIQDLTPELKALLEHASFIYTRETASVEVLRKGGLAGSHIAFAPDATFALTIQDKPRAAAFLREHQLDNRKFIVVVPRLRYTPYHQFKPNNNGWNADRIRMVEEVNAKWKEIDHAKLREAMVAWVRTTKNKVLVCPEMTYQVDIMDELLIDPLPADVKPYVVKRGYWLPDEAASLYARAHTILSFECHSPIIAAANGTPCFYLRQPQDTIKGQMYYDLGLGDWTFEIEQSTGQQITDRLMQVHADYARAQTNVRTALRKVEAQYDTAFSILQQRVGI